MSQIDIRPVTAADHAAWLPLWQAYLTLLQHRTAGRRQPEHLATPDRSQRADPLGPGLAGRQGGGHG